jgi:hypothetical protein
VLKNNIDFNAVKGRTKIAAVEDQGGVGRRLGVDRRDRRAEVR